MKFKSVLLSFAASAAMIAVIAACGERNGGKSSGGDSAEVMLVHYKIEIDEALKAYAAVYERQTGVKIDVRTHGGETPYGPVLAAMFNAGIEPEIYLFNGLTEYMDGKRSGRVTDLSNEPWVNDTEAAFIDPDDGRVVGFPPSIEGWGLAYNRELLNRAGIDPAMMTDIAGIKAAFGRVNSMRDELGIEAAVSLAIGPGMTWTVTGHGMNAYLTLGLPYNDSDRYIDLLNKGQLDSERLRYFGEYMDLLFRNSVRNTLLVGGYDQQLADFALGRTVFLHQGNWSDPTLALFGTNFEMGFVPHAFLPETADGIFAGAPHFWMVNARSRNIEEAKKFLSVMTSTPEGHDYMVNKAGMIPAFNSVNLQPQGHLSRAVQEFSNQGRIYAWRLDRMPAGFELNAGPAFMELALGNIDVAEFVNLVTNVAAGIR